MLFGGLASSDVNRARQLVDEAPDHLHVAGPDLSGVLSRGGRRQ